MKEIIKKLAERLLEHYEASCHKKGKKPYMAEYERNLSLLNPGISTNRLIREYYQEKIVMVIELIGCGLLIVIAITISSLTSNPIDENLRIERKDYGKGSYEIDLAARTESFDYGKIHLTIDERHYTEEEVNSIFDLIAEKMRTLVLQDNESLEYVYTDLYLPTEVEGYPVSIRWESGDYMLVDETGHIKRTDISDNGESVEIKMILTYNQISREYIIPIVVYPKELTEYEQKRIDLEQMIEGNNEITLSDEYLQLPKQMGEDFIIWKEESSPTVMLIILLLFFSLIGIWKGLDKDLTNKKEMRDRELLLEYSEFVSKLQLLLSSGMTLRGAFERIGEEYSKELREGGSKKYAYEELLLCNKKMQDGLSESKCYEFFGKRCNLVNYKKLSSMLMQNLKKGNSGLVKALSMEMKVAFEERKAQALRLGEEAQTKLIFPMILMLSVVMIIIMIPAYMSFGGM